MTVHSVTPPARHSRTRLSLNGFIHYFVLPLALVALWAGSAFADPPGRVGRVGESNGSVWLLQQGATDWIQALRNQPITAEDRLATEAGSRAEVDIGSTTVRLGEDSELQFTQLDDARITIDVNRGSATARLRTRQASTEFAALTAEGRFVPLQQGFYRFDQIPPGSRATVYEGSLRFDASDSTLMVTAGQQAQFWRDGTNVGSGAGYTNYTLDEPTHDEFEQWSAARDQQELRASAPVYVSPEMTGANDLGQYGQWSNSPEYGALWTPTSVAAGWAPYSTGHWDWVAPWGWTWIDDAAWGFAPFHYGRWIRDRDRWAWAPGTYAPRPVYAPALVGWVGGGAPGGPRGGFGGGGGGRGQGPSVGWFPLAPREVYVPGYRATPGYIRGVNAGHASDIPNINAIAQNPQLAAQNHQYRNRDVPGAMTVVATSVMTNREPVPRSAGRGDGFAATAPVRPSAPIGAPPPANNGPGSGSAPRFTVRDPRDVARAYPGYEARTQGGERPGFGQPIPQQPRTGVTGPITPAATPIQPAVPQQPRVGERPETPQQPRGSNQEFEQRRFQQQPVPRMERQQMPQQQFQPQPQPQVQQQFRQQPQPQPQPQIQQPIQQQPRMQPQPQIQMPQQRAQPQPQLQPQPQQPQPQGQPGGFDGRNTFRGRESQR